MSNVKSNVGALNFHVISERFKEGDQSVYFVSPLSYYRLVRFLWCNTTLQLLVFFYPSGLELDFPSWGRFASWVV